MVGIMIIMYVSSSSWRLPKNILRTQMTEEIMEESVLLSNELLNIHIPVVLRIHIPREISVWHH